MGARTSPRCMGQTPTVSSGVDAEAAETLEDLVGEVPEVAPVQELLGARLEDVSEGEALVAMEAGDHLHNMVNVVHGGITTSLAELAASVAILTTLADDEAFTFVSQTTNYERPVIEGRLEARATVIRRGDRISFIEVVVTQEGGEAARAEFTALVQPIET